MKKRKGKILINHKHRKGEYLIEGRYFRFDISFDFKKKIIYLWSWSLDTVNYFDEYLRIDGERLEYLKGKDFSTTKRVWDSWMEDYVEMVDHSRGKLLRIKGSLYVYRRIMDIFENLEREGKLQWLN